MRTHDGPANSTSAPGTPSAHPIFSAQDDLMHAVLGTMCLDGVWGLGSAEGFLDYIDRHYPETER